MRLLRTEGGLWAIGGGLESFEIEALTVHVVLDRLVHLRLGCFKSAGHRKCKECCIPVESLRFCRADQGVASLQILEPLPSKAHELVSTCRW